jgi:hypothetical protein
MGIDITVVIQNKVLKEKQTLYQFDIFPSSCWFFGVFSVITWCYLVQEIKIDTYLKLDDIISTQMVILYKASPYEPLNDNG